MVQLPKRWPAATHSLNWSERVVTETDAPAGRDVYHVPEGRPGPGSVSFGRQIASAKRGDQMAPRSLRTNVGEQTHHQRSYPHVSEPVGLLSLSLSDPPVPSGCGFALPTVSRLLSSCCSLLCRSRVKFPSVLAMFVLTKSARSPGLGCLLSFLIHV